VLSGAVQRGLGGATPEGARLKRLGAWRFRGLPEPIEIFQAQAPDLPSDFPPLRSATPAD
jgi:class 3 adenylate cyclase